MALECGTQPFAIAVAASIASPAVAGTFADFSQGCAGSPGAGTNVCGGLNALPDDVTIDEVGGSNEVGFNVSPPNGAVITGVEMLIGASQPVSARMSLYDVGPHGRPKGQAPRTAESAMAPSVAGTVGPSPSPSG